jgi:transcriptional regulator with XRE-family HTH domain
MLKNRRYNFGHQLALWKMSMPKRTNAALPDFGARLVELRKAAGFTQTELANELGITRRMIAYYEGETDHPPSNLLPGLAQALGVTIEALLGATPPKKLSKPSDSRLQRRLQQIEKMEAGEKRQVLQLIDAFIERGQLKRKAHGKQAAK